MRQNCGVCGSVNRSRHRLLSCLKGTKFIRTGKNNCETGVRLPSRFARNVGEFLEDSASLYFHGVAMWRVQVTQSNGSLTFGKGWARLYKGYGMTKGTVLLFKYLGSSNFRVDIFRSHTGLAVNEPYYGIRSASENQPADERSTEARRIGRPSIDYVESEEVRSVELYGMKLRRFTVYNLKAELRCRKLAEKGCKGELIDRLGKFIIQHGPDYHFERVRAGQGWRWV